MIFGWIDFGVPWGGMTTGPLLVKADGTYIYSVPMNTVRVFVNPGDIGYQPCLMTTAITGNVSLDPIYVSDEGQLGANLPRELLDRTPTLSGIVYEQTASGRRPVPNALLLLDAHGGDDLIVGSTRTDADGRYVFCNMSDLPELAIQVGSDGFDGYTTPPRVGRLTMLDIELKRK